MALLSVLPAGLLVTPHDASRAYGQTNPVFTASYAGFVNGENQSVVGGTLTISTAADTNSVVGNYPITAAGLTSTNYTISYTNGTLTVTPFALTVTADSHTRTYGATNPVLGGTLVGVQNGDNITASYTTTATTTNSPVGTYSIVASLNDPNSKLGNYSVTTNNGVLTVTAATLVGTADNQSRLYGQNNPVFTASYSGFVNGENSSLLSGTLTGSTVADTNSPLGTYPITVSGQSASNYSVQYVNGTLTVLPAALLVTPHDASRAYGQTNPVFTAGIGGLVNGENQGVLGGTLTLSSTADTNSSVGGYPITASGLTSTNYTINYTNGTLTITPFAVTVTVDSHARTYGATNPVIGGTLVGVQNVYNITASYSTTATTNSPVGTYSIVASLNDPNGKLGNYSVTTNNGTLGVTAATLVEPAWTTRAGCMGRATRSSRPSYTGGGNGESTNVLSGSLSGSTLRRTRTVRWAGMRSWCRARARPTTRCSMCNCTLTVLPTALAGDTSRCESGLWADQSTGFTGQLRWFCEWGKPELHWLAAPALSTIARDTNSARRQLSDYRCGSYIHQLFDQLHQRHSGCSYALGVDGNGG